jgi:uncharacterized protein YegL
MTVSLPATYQYSSQCFNYDDPLRLSTLRNILPTSSKGSMLDGLKKRLSMRRSGQLNDPAPAWPPADPARAYNTSSKTASSHNGGLAPPSSDGLFAASSPATRRPSKSSKQRTSCASTPTLSHNFTDSSSMNPFSSSSDAPPAYTAGQALQAPSRDAPRSTSATSDADPYAFLKSFDTIFLIDDSGSMAGRSWKETGKALETITPICTQRDADGVDIYFLNHPDSSIYKNVTSAGTIIEIFQSVRPSGATPTGQRLNKILKPYLQRYEKKPESTKPINIIVITDGEPSDDVESPIIQAAKKLDKLDAPAWQVGIQFFQVGRELGAREHLKQLDDGLRDLAGDDDLRDIVDTVPFTGDGDAELTAAGIMKVVLGKWSTHPQTCISQY